MTIFSASVAMCALPAAFFGMNLASGLEDTPGAFWPVVAASVTAALALGTAVTLGWRRWPRAAAAARAADMQALRELLVFHLDEMDDVLAAVRVAATADTPLTRDAFHAVVKAAFSRGGAGIGGRPMADDELDLLFRVFDSDRDGFLRAGELATAAVGNGGGEGQQQGRLAG